MITGTQNPIVGKEEFYQYNDVLNPLAAFNSSNITYVWNIWKKKNGSWLNITEKPPKIGQKVSFKFGEKVIGEEFKLIVFKRTPKFLSEEFEEKKMGEFFLVPTSSKVSKIDRVVLFNGGAKDPNKATYKDTLIARAYCIAMFNQEVQFNLWEDDAQNGGHNASINKNNQLPQTFKARVNEKGIAEVKISLLSSASVLKAIANKYMMSGDKSEGANHEFYVTASYAGKIQKASQVNVANPDYKTKPKEDSAKFPATDGSKTKKEPDAKGNIKDAYFVNDKNQKLSRVPVDSHVRVQILSDGMKGKFIQYVVWEEDVKYIGEKNTHDEIFRSGQIKIEGDVITTGGFTITDRIFKKGIDSDIKIFGNGDPDLDKQNYFLEIIVKDSTAESKKFGIDDKAGQPMEVVRSASVVKEVKKEANKDSDAVCEYEARVRAFMRMLRFKEGTSGEKGYTTQYSGKQFSDFSKHPDEVITAGGYSSSAAGAYQIMADTWKNLTGHFRDKNNQWAYSEKLDKAKKYSITSFDQESQDKFCLIIMKHNYLQDRSDSFYNPTVWKNKAKKIHDTVKEAKQKEWRKRFKGQQGDIIQMIIDDDIKRASLISSLCWASLPDSPYGQQSSTYTFAIVKAIYEKNLKEELIAPNPELHLKKGFLKEFGYGCCGEETTKEIPTTSKCPEDCSQCFEYSDVVANPRISNQSDNVNKNRFHKAMRINNAHPKGYYHTGVDILAKLNTDLKSMLCGEVTEAFDTGGDLGKIVTIKSKDKTGKNIWIRYCHLNSISVKKDQFVKHGETFGKSGNTGNAKNVSPQYFHVHIEASTNGVHYGGNTRVDPEQFMKTKFDETTKGNPIK